MNAQLSPMKARLLYYNVMSMKSWIGSRQIQAFPKNVLSEVDTFLSAVSKLRSEIKTAGDCHTSIKVCNPANVFFLQKYNYVLSANSSKECHHDWLRPLSDGCCWWWWSGCFFRGLSFDYCLIAITKESVLLWFWNCGRQGKVPWSSCCNKSLPLLSFFLHTYL